MLTYPTYWSFPCLPSFRRKANDSAASFHARQCWCLGQKIRHDRWPEREEEEKTTNGRSLSNFCLNDFLCYDAKLKYKQLHQLMFPMNDVHIQTSGCFFFLFSFLPAFLQLVFLTSYDLLDYFHRLSYSAAATFAKLDTWYWYLILECNWALLSRFIISEHV